MSTRNSKGTDGGFSIAVADKAARTVTDKSASSAFMFIPEAESVETSRYTTESTSTKRFKPNSVEAHADADCVTLATRIARLEACDIQHRCRLDAFAQRIKAVAASTELIRIGKINSVGSDRLILNGNRNIISSSSSSVGAANKRSISANERCLNRAGRSTRSGKVERQLAAAAEELMLRSMPNEFIGADGLRRVPPAVSLDFSVLPLASFT